MAFPIMKSLFAVVLVLAASAAAASGQPVAHEPGAGHAAHAGAGASAAPASQPSGRSPYAGLQGRSIKAFSDEQLADLRAGKGMALALPAELNGYPGPAHVLELAERLGLDEAQLQQTRHLMGRMKAEALVLGERLVAAESELDRLFSQQRASAAAVAEASAAAARAQGLLRASHLQYHLDMVELLTPAQVARYRQLRGYE